MNAFALTNRCVRNKLDSVLCLLSARSNRLCCWDSAPEAALMEACTCRALGSFAAW